jgi:hypothetical protein
MGDGRYGIAHGVGRIKRFRRIRDVVICPTLGYTCCGAQPNDDAGEPSNLSI